MSAAQRSGDLRIAATARTTLARLLRASGDDVVATALLEQTDRWYRTAGGGDGALLVRGLLAAIADDGDLDGVLAEARRTGDREAELVALDALARRAADAGRPGSGDRGCWRRPTSSTPVWATWSTRPTGPTPGG